MLGSIISETGAASAAFAGTAGVLKAWASYTNAHGGVNGHPVQLVIKDDQSSPSVGLQDANELVSQHVLALVEGGTGTASNWASVVQKAGIPVVGGDPAAAPPWGVNPDFYGTVGSGAAATDIFTKAAISEGKSKIGVPYCKEVAACTTALTDFQASAKKYGAQVFGEAVSLSAPSYAAPCLALKSDGAQVGYAVVTPNVTESLLTQCAQQGWKPTWIVSDVQTSDATNPLLNGFIGFLENFPWFANTPVAETYRAAMNQYDPTALTNNASEGPVIWASGLLFQEAASKGSLGDNATSAQLIKGLDSISNDDLGGATGPLTFTNGNRSNKCSFTITVQNGHFVATNGGVAICTS